MPPVAKPILPTDQGNSDLISAGEHSTKSRCILGLEKKTTFKNLTIAQVWTRPIDSAEGNFFFSVEKYVHPQQTR